MLDNRYQVFRYSVPSTNLLKHISILRVVTPQKPQQILQVVCLGKEINLTKLKFFIKKNNIYQIILIKLKFQLQFFAVTLEKINAAKNLYRDQIDRQVGSQQNPSFSRQPNGNESTVKYGKNRGFIFLNQPFPSEIEQRKNTKIRE